ncbi:MAG: hypothetical protein WD266_01480 [Balneolales bacterium]
MREPTENALNYSRIVAHYESCLARHGDSAQGVDWPNAEDACTRYQVMLDMVKSHSGAPVTLLDFGCGMSHLYEYMLRTGIENINYSGLDISEKYTAASKYKFPDNSYLCLDILKEMDALPEYEYIIMNGVFTEKCSLSFDEMWVYLQEMLSKVFLKAKTGLAFNVMSKQVDWEREDLFHVPMDLLSAFLKENLSRHFVIRHDYDLYEYSTYLYKNPLGMKP